MSGTIYLVTTSVALELNDELGSKRVLEKDEILDPQQHPQHAIDAAIEQGLIAIVSAEEAEKATARLAERWAAKNEPLAYSAG